MGQNWEQNREFSGSKESGNSQGGGSFYTALQYDGLQTLLWSPKEEFVENLTPDKLWEVDFLLTISITDCVSISGQWAVPPTGQVPNCPPGLEYLLAVDQLLVHQKVELLEGLRFWYIEICTN